jgi:hypothetical protein
LINILKTYTQYKFKQALRIHNLRDIERYQISLPETVFYYISTFSINRIIDILSICLKKLNISDILSLDEAKSLFSTYKIKNLDIVSAVINYYPDIWNKKMKIHFLELYFRDIYVSSGLNASFIDNAVVFDELILTINHFYQQHLIENEIMNIAGYTIFNQYDCYTVLDFIAYLHINKVGDSNGHFINDKHIILLLNNGFRFSVDQFYQQFEHLLDENLNQTARIARTFTFNNIEYLKLILNISSKQEIVMSDIAISLD